MFEDETVGLLRELLRLDTSNPPGNERPAQELVAGRLRAAGFEVELVGSDPERPNVVGRLRGRAPGPVLGLLSHVDTVLADPRGWRHDPWSGAARRGLRVGTRRARHEVADRRRGGGRLLAGAGGLAPGARRPSCDLRLGRRGGRDRRRDRLRGAARPRPLRLPAQRGRRRGVPVRRRPRLRRLGRREGRLPLHALDRRGGRTRLGSGGRRQRAAEAGSAARGACQPHARLGRDPRRARPACRARARRRRATAIPWRRSAACANGRRSWCRRSRR